MFQNTIKAPKVLSLSNQLHRQREKGGNVNKVSGRQRRPDRKRWKIWQEGPLHKCNIAVIKTHEVDLCLGSHSRMVSHSSAFPVMKV